jgi:hypothetical protein
MSKTTRWLWLAVAIAVFFVAAAACGDDDDDDDDDFVHGDDDAAGDDDDMAAEGDCADYAEEFFGEAGCFPDEGVYLSTLQLCGDLADQNASDTDDFFICVGKINCDDFDALIDLYDKLQQCLAQLPG